MIEYLLIAIAFAIMIHVRYIHDVLKSVADLRILLDIEHEENPFTPVIFSCMFFIIVTIFMPVMAYYTMIVSRQEVIKEITSTIMKSYFKLEEK